MDTAMIATARAPAATISALPTRPFGNTGEHVSVLGFGTAPIGLSGYQDSGFDQRRAEDESIRTLLAAIDHGITFFDTAPAYANKLPTDGWSTDRASERMLGIALRARQRDRLFVATKHMYDRGDPASIRKSLECSLRLLGTDHVDLFQVHGTIFQPFRADNWREFVTDEMLRTFEQLREEGKTRYIGISGYREEALCAAIESGAFQAVMPQFNYFYRHPELQLVKIAERAGVAVLPMRPLTGGLLSKMLSELFPDAQPAKDPYAAVADYLLSFPSVCSLPIGMRTVREVEHNVRLIRRLHEDLPLNPGP